MQNSFCQSPSLEFGKCTNFSPLMPNFTNENPVENSPFWINNLWSKKGRSKFNMKEDEVEMTPLGRKKKLKTKNLQSLNSFNTANSLPDAIFNNDSNLIKSDNKNESYFNGYKAHMSNNVTLGDVFIKEEEVEVKKVPAVQSSILKNGKRSSFVPCLPKQEDFMLIEVNNYDFHNVNSQPLLRNMNIDSQFCPFNQISQFSQFDRSKQKVTFFPFDSEIIYENEELAENNDEYSLKGRKRTKIKNIITEEQMQKKKGKKTIRRSKAKNKKDKNNNTNNNTGKKLRDNRKSSKTTHNHTNTNTYLTHNKYQTKNKKNLHMYKDENSESDSDLKQKPKIRCQKIIEKVKKEIKEELNQISKRKPVLSEIVNQSISKVKKNTNTNQNLNFSNNRINYLTSSIKFEEHEHLHGISNDNGVFREPISPNLVKVENFHDNSHDKSMNKNSVSSKSFFNKNLTKEDPDLNSTCNYVNKKIKRDYLQYLIYGKANEKKLSFGADPKSIKIDLYLSYEKEKKLASQGHPSALATSVVRSSHILEKLNELKKAKESLPILVMPEGTKYQAPKIKKKNSQYKYKNSSSPVHESFQCKFCPKSFNSRQGLGGHVSRMHKGKSESYNKKTAVRIRRQEERERLKEIKRRIVNKYGENFDELLVNKLIDGKKIIKNILEENKLDYLRLKREMKRKIKNHN